MPSLTTVGRNRNNGIVTAVVGNATVTGIGGRQKFTVLQGYERGDSEGCAAVGGGTRKGLSRLTLSKVTGTKPAFKTSDSLAVYTVVSANETEATDNMVITTLSESTKATTLFITLKRQKCF